MPVTLSWMPWLPVTLRARNTPGATRPEGARGGCSTALCAGDTGRTSPPARRGRVRWCTLEVSTAGLAACACAVPSRREATALRRECNASTRVCTAALLAGTAAAASLLAGAAAAAAVLGLSEGCRVWTLMWRSVVVGGCAAEVVWCFEGDFGGDFGGDVVLVVGAGALGSCASYDS